MKAGPKKSFGGRRLILLTAMALGVGVMGFRASRQGDSPTTRGASSTNRASLESRTNLPADTPADYETLPKAAQKIQQQSELARIQELEVSLNSPDASVRNQAAEHLFPDLLSKNAQAAASVAESVTNPLLKEQLLRSVAIAWTEDDPAGALAWAENLAAADDRQVVRITALTQISSGDPKSAVLLRQQHPETAADDAELPNLAQRWAEKDLTAALQWADSLPPGEQRDLITARAAFVQAQSSPAEAAQLILDRMSSKDARREALLSVLNQWARQDFSAAANWVAQLVDSPLKYRAEEELHAAAQLPPY